MGLMESEGLLQLVDTAVRRHQAISNNIANVNTPGYRTMRLNFKKRLDDLLDESVQLKPGEKLELEIGWPLFDDIGPDGNDVMLEREIVELNRNTLRLQTYLGVLGFRIRQMRMAIEGR